MSRLLDALLAEPVGTLRTGLWSARAIRRARHGLDPSAGPPLTLPRAPRVPAQSEAAVHALLRLSRQSCLVVAAVRQAWMHAQGDDRDVVVGVRRGEGAFAAHAWVDGDEPGSFAGYHEIARHGYGEPLSGRAAGIRV